MRRSGLAQHIRTYPGGNTEADGMRAAELVAAEAHPPTAVIAFNDRSAVGLIFGLRRAGLSVPEDISVIGYDDIPMATLPFVDLTTVGQDATATARCVFEQVSGRSRPNASAEPKTRFPLPRRTQHHRRAPHTIYPNIPAPDPGAWTAMFR